MLPKCSYKRHIFPKYWQYISNANIHITKWGFSLYTPWGPPPSKSDKTLYTDIYLSTFREGTHFIIKVVVLWPTGLRESLPPLHLPSKLNKILFTDIYLPTFWVGRAETLQLAYSCQLLAVYIQYKHINYTDISQFKYKHMYYKLL